MNSTRKTTIFISSVQKELQEERRALKDYIQGDPLLRRFFDVFLFEDLPASDLRADDVYLDEVDRCGIYVGLYGNEYGSADREGVSPTEREFDRATAKAKVRLIFVKGAGDKGRHPKMLLLVRKAGAQLIRRRFTGSSDLTADLYASLVEHLERAGTLRTRPFDASVCPDATITDISEDKVRWFVSRARRERQFVLDENTPGVDVLTHLNLFDGGQPTNAALMLFGRNPQRFLLTSEVKCMHFHGTEVRKPIPSYQIYKGTVFDLVEQSVDFVMSKIARMVGTRAKGPEAPVEYELPRDAVAEAIVNAVAHRDYASNASVQVMLFSVSKPTATRDLDVLARKNVLLKIGVTGKGTHYTLTHKGLKGIMAKPAINPTNRTLPKQYVKGAKEIRNRKTTVGGMLVTCPLGVNRMFGHVTGLD
jgi:hypothetical protein